MTQEDGGLFDEAEVIFSYSRAEAIADGVLVDVTKRASEVGFLAHMAITAAVNNDVIFAENNQTGSLGDSIFDVLLAANMAAHESVRINPGGSDPALFTVRFGPADAVRSYDLKLHVGSGDNGELVFTIMLSDED